MQLRHPGPEVLRCRPRNRCGQRRKDEQHVPRLGETPRRSCRHSETQWSLFWILLQLGSWGLKEFKALVLGVAAADKAHGVGQRSGSSILLRYWERLWLSGLESHGPSGLHCSEWPCALRSLWRQGATWHVRYPPWPAAIASVKREGWRMEGPVNFYTHLSRGHSGAPLVLRVGATTVGPPNAQIPENLKCSSF